MPSRTSLLRALSSTVLVSLVMLGTPVAGHAFDNTWFFNGCVDVAAGDSGLWDDMPGAGVNNDSGLLWMVTNGLGNEQCTYAALPDATTGSYATLRMRVAVNDGAIFTVHLLEGSEFCGGGFVIGTLATTGAQDNNAWITKSVALPAGHAVTEVCITITDDPNNVASQRASALIDYIKIFNGSTVIWQENFARAN